MEIIMTCLTATIYGFNKSWLEHVATVNLGKFILKSSCDKLIKDNTFEF